MCDRNKAIKYIITNQFGNKDELVSQIKGHYETFVLTGLIFEPSRLPESITGRSAGRDKREWVATPEAYRRAEMLSIKPDKSLRLDSTPPARIRQLMRRMFFHSFAFWE